MILVMKPLRIFSWCLAILSPLSVLSTGPGSVNPLIGTGGHGHTYPGATLPFGMIQVSPDTRLEGWDGCSGYHFSDSVIYGFSHTHLSGTGCSDYGDILLMPIRGPVGLQDHASASSFSHANEKATPGYYSVLLDTPGVTAELTATRRTGFHRYTYPAAGEPGIVLSLQHRDKVIASGIKITGDQELQGFRFSSAWAPDQRLFFIIRFSEPFLNYTIELDGAPVPGIREVTGEDIKARFIFPGKQQGARILVKIGISAVSAEGARKNLEAENPGWDFDRIRREAHEAWSRELQKIRVTGGTKEEQTIFYTALYHAMLSPNLYMDVDGQYLGRDMQVHVAEGFEYYTVFSLWDTYRALHPLLTIIDRKRTLDFIQTFLHQYEEGGMLPVWELSSNETWCMIGYHSVPVIADAWLKGIRGFDAEKAMEAMKHSALQDHLGLASYREMGFIPADEEAESVSRTLEYAYDDWCIAMMAQAMGREQDYQEFIRRAQYYKNLWDPSTGFMRAKRNNRWIYPFDPYEVNFNYTEANAWQYSFYVPQDIPGLITLLGGKEAFSGKLDELFSARIETTGRDQADITGLIGQYAHGNEPSHHMAYLYAYAGEAWKTRELVGRIMQEFYSDTPEGLCGNEDCGQMSAWYVFSALGFYPVTPCSGEYVLGTPLFRRAEIRMENGNTFTIRNNQASGFPSSIQSCTLNGKIYQEPVLRHADIMNSGKMVFGEENAGETSIADEAFFPSYRIPEDELLQPVPFVAKGESVFFDSTLIALGSPDPEATIYFSTAVRDTSDAWPVYTAPFKVQETTILHAYARKEGRKPSRIIRSVFQKMPERLEIVLYSQYSPQYTAGGDNALIDLVRGGNNFHTGAWQGYEGTDLDAVIDLGEIRQVTKISVGFLQDVRAWIFFPVEVTFYTSCNGMEFTPAGVSVHEVSQKDYTVRTLEQWADLDPPAGARFIRVVAKSQRICPGWHHGAGKKCWLFSDEITITELR